nr:n,o-diacetylmuramidase [Quercus suber]
MKSILSYSVALAAIASAAPTGSLLPRDSVQGFDVSHYQASVNFASAYSGGLRFVFIKATEGTAYTDPTFSDHYNAATKAGFIRGGYHFAHGDEDAATQANFFLKNGGGWSNDGITLPGMLDLEGDCVSIHITVPLAVTRFSTLAPHIGRNAQATRMRSSTQTRSCWRGMHPAQALCPEDGPTTPSGNTKTATHMVGIRTCSMVLTRSCRRLLLGKLCNDRRLGRPVEQYEGTGHSSTSRAERVAK